MESKKRKRETELPRVTYDAATRTFDRLFKEDSLDDMKAVVRRKLSLSPSFPVYLSQWRDGKSVDLEDDEDFEAFSASAHASLTVKVKVVLGGHQPPPLITETEVLSSESKRSRKKKEKTRASSVSDDGSEETTHRSKRQKVTFVEEGSDSAQLPSETKSKKKDQTQSLPSPSPGKKLTSTDTEIEQSQSERDIEKKKKKKSKKTEVDEGYERSDRHKRRSRESSTAPSDSTAASVPIAGDVLTESIEKSKKSKKRTHVSSSPSPSETGSTKTNTETAINTFNLHDERLAKKAKKTTSDRVSDEGSLPPTSHLSLHSAAVSIHSTAAVTQDATSSKKSKKSTENTSKKRSSSQSIGDDTAVTTKPKSRASSVASTTPTASAVPLPEKETSEKKQKQNSKKSELPKEKPERVASGTKEIPVPETMKNLPTVPGTKEKSKKGKEKVSAESGNSGLDKVVKQKKSQKEIVEQPPEGQGQSQAKSTDPSKTADIMKELTRLAVERFEKTVYGKKNDTSSEVTQSTSQIEQPEPNGTDQTNATIQGKPPSLPTSQPPVSQPSKPSKPVKKSQDSTCPVCNGQPLHARSRCPIIKAGIRSMRNKISELEKETSDEGAESRSSIILELQGMIDKKARKPRASEIPKTIPDQPSTTNPVSLKGQGGVPPLSVENPQTPAHTKQTAIPPSIALSTESSSSIRASSSNKGKSPASAVNSKPSPSIQLNPVKPSLTQPTSQDLVTYESSTGNTLSKSHKSEGARLSETTKNSSSDLNGFGDVSSFTDQDLDALVRGPRLSLKNMVSQSDSESEESESEDEDVVLEDDQDEDKKTQRNLSRSGYPSSSDPESSDDVEAEEEEEVLPPSPHNDSPEAAIVEEEKEGGDLSFLEVNGLGSSVELDRTGDLAADAAMDADLAPLNLTKEPEAEGQNKKSDDDASDSDFPSPPKFPLASSNKTDLPDPIEISDVPPASQPEPIASDEEAPPAESTPKAEVAVRTRSQRNTVAKKPDAKSNEKPVTQNKVNDVKEPEVEEVPKLVRRTRSLVKISELPVPPNPSVRVIRQAVAPTPTPRTRRQTALEQDKEKEGSPEPELATRTRRTTAANKTKPPPKTPVKPQSKATKTPAKPLARQKALTNIVDNEKAPKKLGDADATQITESSMEVQTKPSLKKDKKDKTVSSWTVLQESQPSQTDTQPLEMVDELPSSPRNVPAASPDDQSGEGQKPVSANGSEPGPLFIPAESQQSFPYSQFPDVLPKPVAHASPNESEDENEVIAAVTKPVNGSIIKKTYRSLRELSSQAGRLFQPRPSQIMKAVREPQNEDLYGRKGQQSEDSDSSTDSDAEDKPASHIPAGRRAGAPNRR